MGANAEQMSKWPTVSLIALLLVAASAGVVEAIDIGSGLLYDALIIGPDSVVAYGTNNPDGVNLSDTGTLSDVVYLEDGGVVYLAGGHIEQSLYVFQGGEAHITAGSVGWYIVVMGGNVTVYGTDFAEDVAGELRPLDAGDWTPSGVGVLAGYYEDDSLIDLFFYSATPIHLVEPSASGPIVLSIDIKPGSDDNSINLRSRGVVPVAILSAPDFDATLLPPENIFFAGAAVRMRGKSGKYAVSYEDVNGDGLVDLVVQVATQDLNPAWFEDGGAYLAVCEEPDPDSAVLALGWDKITIVPARQGPASRGKR